MLGLMDLLFGCTHRRYTFPITAKAGQSRPAAASVTGTYVVCLDCGKEFPYDWKQMRMVSLTPARTLAAQAAEAGASAAADLKAA
jgi:predicted transcriptional regulator